MDELVADDDAADGTSAFFVSYQALSDECEPYAFVARDADDTWWRLPEDERFYFATVGHPNELIDDSASCAEKHYFSAIFTLIITRKYLGGFGLCKISNYIKKWLYLNLSKKIHLHKYR